MAFLHRIHRSGRALGLALLAGVVLSTGGEWAPRDAAAQIPLTARPPTAAPPTQPPPPTDAPTAAPPLPTAAPPTDAPPPTNRPDRDDDDRNDNQDEAPPPPPPGTEGPTGEPSPTRTRRPTRTPRTTPTPSPTTMVAGALRLTLSSEPPVLVAGAPATLVLVLANQGDGPALGLTLQTDVPGDVIVEEISPDGGQVVRSGGLVRWYVARLEQGDEARLDLSGVLARARPDGVRLCALLLSAAAPLEHCVVLPTTVDPADATGDAGLAVPTEYPDEGPTENGLTGGLDVATVGWAVLVIGLGVLGLAAGLSLRGRRG